MSEPATSKPPTLGTVLAWCAGGVMVMGLGAGYGMACYQYFATAFPGPHTGVSHHMLGQTIALVR